MTAAIATYAQSVVAAQNRSWRARLLGHAPGADSTVVTARERLAAHFERNSVWLHNSVRAAIGFGLSVLLADGLAVQHAFWVVFGTLSVLRGNALNTGQSALRAMAGTVAGVLVAGVLVDVVGTHTLVSWILLPFAVALTAIAPAAISFAAGQAAFTLVLMLIFDIVDPTGWAIGAARVEDMALGSAVSVVVGLLLWPRGAGGALRETAATGLLNTTRYLVAATRFALTRCDATASKPEPPRGERRRAVDPARRLDDGFRQFAAERGTKRVPVADIATIVTAVAALRRAADAICALWADDDASGGERTAARLEILQMTQQVATWFDKVATGLLDLAAMPQPLAEDGVAIRRLIAAVLDDLTDGDGRVADTAVAMVWTISRRSGDCKMTSFRPRPGLPQRATPRHHRAAADAPSLFIPKPPAGSRGDAAHRTTTCDTDSAARI